MTAALDVDERTQWTERPTRRRRPAAIAAVVAVLLIGGGLGLRWWTHPTAFGDLGDEFVAAPDPVTEAALSTTVVFPQVSGELETVTIDGARAEFSQNSARASATFWVCHLSPGDEVIGTAADPADFCADFVPLESGTRFHHDVAPQGDYLFVTITPTRAGVARLERVELDYRRGAGHLFQGGTESIRVVREVTAQ